MLEKIKYYITHPATLVTTGIALISTLGYLANFITHLDGIYRAPIEVKHAVRSIDSIARIMDERSNVFTSAHKELEDRFVADSIHRANREAEASDFFAVGIRASRVSGARVYRDEHNEVFRLHAIDDSTYYYFDMNGKLKFPFVP